MTKPKKPNPELEQMTELAKRAMADLQNLKRRQEEEKAQFVTFANAQLILQILPILDNLQRAKQHIPKGAEEWAKGIEMSVENLKKVFQDTGVTPIEALNQPFNPELHEAVAQGPGKKDMVLEELEKGYMLGEKVLRHTKVKVGIS